MIQSQRKNSLAAVLSLAVLALHSISPAEAVTEEILVLGSSVAAGTGASPTSQAWAYRLEDLMENHAPIVPGSTVTWQVNNASVGGDTTSKVLARFQADVVNAHPGTNIVIISLSLANEGLVGSPNPDAVYNSFRNGLSQIIDLCRNNGYYPVISLPYPHGTYSENEYGYVRKMNLLLNTWNIPSINYLGALDDGSGRWAAGYWSDSYHPNNIGHAELYYSVVPSMFDAITAGKTTSPQIAGTNNFLRMQRDGAETSPIRYTPSYTTHSFTMAFRVRSTDVGTVAAVSSGSSRATLEIRDNAFVYVGPTGAELSVPMDANDGHWHDVALSHRYATGQSLFFVDGVLKGTVNDQYIPDQFVIDGAAGASGRALAPLQADFQDVCIYRAAWSQDEAMAQSKGALQQASLEICATLADAAPVSGNAFENRAQGMSSMTLNTSNFSALSASTVPDGLSVVSTTGSTVSLSWTSHGSSGFSIERRRSGVAEAWITAGTSPSNTPSFTDTGLLPGTSYDYRVSTQDGSFQSDYTDVVPALTTQVVPAGSLLWDADGGIAGAQDGSGTWDAATTTRWYNGSTNQTWGNPSAPGNVALFGSGGTSGTVSLSGTLNAGGLYFTQGGYILSGGTFNISPAAATPFLYSTNGGTSTINSTITSAGGTLITKTGAGTVNITAGGGGSGSIPALYTVTGGTYNSTSGTFDSILAMPAANRLGVQAASPTTVLTLDAGTFQITSATGNALATNRRVLVNAAGGAISDFGSNNFYQPPIINNAGAGSSLYLSNISGVSQFQGVISGTGSITWYGAGTASFQTSNTYSGGTTIVAGTVSVTQDSSLGTGPLSFSGNGTLQSGSANRILANPINLGTTSDVIDTNGNTLTLSGPISNSAAINNAIKAAGTGTLVLSGNLDLTGHVSDTNSPAIMLGNRNGANFNRGTVIITGTGTISRISTGWDNTANTFTFASTGSVTMANDFVSGQSASGVGVLKITGGTLNLQNLNMANWDGSYGAVTMSGGTINTTNLRNGGNGNGNGNSYTLMTGGTINVAEVTTISRNGNGTNVLHLQGANAQFNEGNNRLNVGFSGDSTGVVTVESGLLTVASNLSLAEGNTSSTFGILNLNGGIVRPNTIVAGSAGGKSIVNFNGGTLQARINHASFMGGLTAANIFSGGAIIDSDSLAVTISQNLRPAAGNGVTGIPLSTGGSGYLGAPVVKITGGGGTGATAVATISGGVVTGIQITSAGTGYTIAPTVTLVGGGATTTATLGSVSITANAADGGLTKAGSGVLTLSGANTYAGPTNVSSGNLVVSGSLGAASSVTVSANATLSGTGNVSGTVTTLASTATIAPGTGGIGVLTTGPTDLSGTLAVDVSGTSGDKLAVNGNLNITGAVLTINPLAPLTGSVVIAQCTGGTITGTFSVPSGYTVNYTSTTATLSAATVGNYASWATTNGIPGQPASGDFDKDGLNNLVEYALGLNPTTSSTPAGSFSGGVLSYAKGSDAMTNGDVTIEIEQSDALSGWVVVVPNAPASPTISYTLPPGQPKEFARLKITRIP